jgi:hypothetical protein
MCCKTVCAAHTSTSPQTHIRPHTQTYTLSLTHTHTHTHTHTYTTYADTRTWTNSPCFVLFSSSAAPFETTCVEMYYFFEVRKYPNSPRRKNDLFLARCDMHALRGVSVHVDFAAERMSNISFAVAIRSENGVKDFLNMLTGCVECSCTTCSISSWQCQVRRKGK